MRMLVIGIGMVLATTASATVSLPCGGGTEAEAEAQCAAFAKGGHAVAICGGVIAADVDARAAAICGKAIADCEGGDIMLKLSVVEDACSQAQEMSAAATLTAGDTAVECGSAAQTCGDVAVSCRPAPLCPDVSIEANLITCKKVKHKKDGTVVGRYCRAFVGTAVPQF
jgi:hypothetical protein